MRITQETSRDEEVLDIVRAGMRRHAESQVPWETYEDLLFIARDEDDNVVGAAIGEAGRGWLKVELVWVHEDVRERGLGTQLMAKIEKAGIDRGCMQAYLNTFSYQARPFYEKLGYEVFGTLDDYPVGHQRFYMRKRLTPTQPEGEG